MHDTTRPTCAVGGTFRRGMQIAACGSAIGGTQCGATPGTCEHQREAVRQPADTGVLNPRAAWPFPVTTHPDLDS